MLKHPKYIILQLWMSEVHNESQQAKMKAPAALHSFLETVRQDLFSPFLQPLEVGCISCM